MVHAEVYDLTEHASKGLDQRHNRLDCGHCRAKHVAEIQTSDTELGQFILDALQPLRGSKLAEDLFYRVADARELPGERIKDSKAALAENLPNDGANVLEMVSQQRNHRNHRAQARDGRAERAEQRHKAAAQLSENAQRLHSCARQIQAILSECCP